MTLFWQVLATIALVVGVVGITLVAMAVFLFVVEAVVDKMSDRALQRVGVVVVSLGCVAVLYALVTWAWSVVS